MARDPFADIFGPDPLADIFGQPQLEGSVTDALLMPAPKKRANPIEQFADAPDPTAPNYRSQVRRQSRIRDRVEDEFATRAKAYDEEVAAEEAAAREQYQQDAMRRAGGAYGAAVGAEETERERIAGGGDTVGELGEKFVENLGPRAKQWAGGFLQAIGETSQDWDNIGGSVKLADYVKEFDRVFIEQGQRLSKEGGDALKANAPDFGAMGQNNPLRYLYDVSNSIIDLAAATGVAAATRNPSAGARLLGVQVFGQQYDESRSMGRTPDQAMVDASFMSFAEFVGESKVIGAFLKPGGKSLGGKIVEGARNEALQEAVTGVLQTGYDKGVLNPNMTWGEAARAVVDSAILGAGAGAAVAGGAYALNRKARRDEGEALGLSPEVAEAYADIAPEPDVPLTEADRASPIPDEIIQQGKNDLRDGMREMTGAPKPKAVKPGGLPSDILSFFKAKGYSDEVAQGIAAGIVAESRADHSIVNPTSGAFGLGQWLGPRKKELFRRYGQNPTRAQQLEFLHWELQGGDFGGKAVLGSRDAVGALDNYITKFMRPAKGAETSGDMKRGRAALGLGETDTGAFEGGSTGFDRDMNETPEEEGIAAKVSRILGEDLDSFVPGQRVDVTQGDSTVPGTVAEVYGEGAERGVRIDRDDGTTFDETLERARQFGARLTNPVEPRSPVATQAPDAVSVPDVAAPLEAEAPRGDSSLNDTASWVIRNKDSGEVVMETFDRAKVDALNTEKYEAVPIGEYLGSINGAAAPTAIEAAPDLTTQPAAKFDPLTKVPDLKALVTNSRISLSDTNKIAKALGVSKAQARQVMGALGSQKGSGFVMSKSGKLRRVAKRTKPLNAMEFVRSIGGVQSGRDDLRNVGAIARYPGVINNRSGRTMDEIGELLWEAGYIIGDRPTTAETIEYLDRASLKKTYRAEDALDAVEETTDEQNEEDMRRAVEDYAAEMGFELGEEELADAIRNLDGSLSPAEAVIEAINDQAARVIQDAREQAGETEWDWESIYEGEQQAEGDRDAQEDQPGPARDEGGAEGRGARDAEPAPDSSEGVAPSDSQIATDVLAERPGDQRTALERQAEGRLKGTKPQKAPGSDGGLFDTQDTTGDLFDAPAAPAPAAPATATRTKASDSRDGEAWEPRVAGGISKDDTWMILREQGVPVMELDGTTPTGWRQIPMTNGDGAILIHETREEARRFTGKAWRQYAPAYAMDHVTPPNPLWENSVPGRPRVVVNLVGRDGLTDAERGGPLPAAPTNVREATEAGKAAFTAGSERRLPTEIGAMPSDDSIARQHKRYISEAWYKGWDQANLAAPVPEEAPAQPAGYGSANKLVTADRAAEIRAKLKDKFRTQINSGIDPEMLALGTELAVFHIEAGARKFADFARAVARDLDQDIRALKPFLRGWYLGAQAMIEDNGGDVDGMDGPGAVRAALAMLEDNAPLSPPVDGIGENEETPNVGNAVTPEPIETDRGSDAGQSASDAPRVESLGRADEGAERSDGASDGGVPGGLSERDGGRDDQRSAADPAPASANRARPSRRVRGKPAERGANFLAPSGALKRDGSWLATANRNLDIIELVNRLETEQRPATADEQALLAKFTGWGASDIKNKLFKDVDRTTQTIKPPLYGAGEWTDTIKRASELLRGNDLKVAMQSVQYAHYTSEGIVRGIWSALDRMGFAGGRILEPGMGIGNFFTAAPASAMESSSYTGIEMDAFTARIAKLLLPQENVIEGDFVKAKLPDGFFDAAIGNPPFANIKILDDPTYKKHRFSLHDYFFAKSIDKVRPGGLLTFVTSRYTMDKLDPKARKYIAERADFLGAIRLPQTAFKENAGTEVVTDVLFFQRRAPGAEPGGQAWLDTKQVTVGGEKIAINEYFAANKDMILGKNATTGSMYRANEYTVEPYATGSIESHFAKAIANLPADIYTDQPAASAEAVTAKAYDRDFAPASSKEGGLYVKDGKVLVVDSGSGVPVEAVREKLKPADVAWLKDYTALRDALKEAQKAQLADAADWETTHAALVKGYRAFTKKHGRIREFTPIERMVEEDANEGDPGAYQNKKGDWVAKQPRIYRRFKWEKLLSLDVEGPLVMQLERISDAGEISDGPFLLGRTLNKPTRREIATVEDAMAVNLDEIGKLDLDYIAKLIGQTREQVVDQLGDQVFKAPDGSWQTADEYLSGNVLEKLEQAQAAAATEPEFERNVKALMAVQPPPLAYSNITVKLGAPWIRPETVSEFAAEVLGFRSVPIKYDAATAHWTVEGSNQRWQRSASSDWGTAARSGLELLDAILNNRTIRVMTPKTKDESPKTDEAATTAAVEAAKKIAARFQGWLWEDSARTGEYVEVYNRTYNNIAPRRFNGDHLTTPGLSSHLTLYPHQKRAVWRMIQTGNTYLAHAVGAGKTFEMIVGGQEMRRLGLIKKPMYVVPNHMLNQFAHEFLEAYPAANIMVADEQSFHTGNRRRFLAQAALNDPDAIILTHSAFGKIDASDDAKATVLADMVAELEAAMEEAKEGDASRHTVSRIEKQIEALERKFGGRQGQGKDKLLTFDELGVDFLFVDEAHEFRKLDFATNRAAKGIDSSGSGKAMDLFIKSRWLHQQRPGRSMVLASGTPVTNTMAELFTVMRYMALDALDRDRMKAFDAWANMFGEVVAAYEKNAAGGYEVVERFARFVNVPELMKRVREFMDVLTSEQLGDLVKRPSLNGGGPQNIVAPASDELETYMKMDLDLRLEVSRQWKPSKEQPGNPDPVINIITDARLSAIDMRFVRSGKKSDPASKLNTMIGKIAATHKATANLTYPDKSGGTQPRKGGAQIVFSPVGFGEQVAASRGFDAKAWMVEELERQGVKRAEIAFIADANTHAKKEQLQKDVRSGKVRILVGSPKNMGTGLNVQDRLVALHYLAPPWYPADVEQPHGRIIRQGNLNPSVDIFWYATEGTYDSTGWSMVARKAKFIEQALSGDDSVRVLDDISESSLYEMASALAAGDDRLIQVASMTTDIDRLQRLKQDHATTQRTLRGQIKELGEFEIPRLEKRIAGLTKANEARGVGYQPFAATVKGKRYDKHGEAGEAITRAMQEVVNNNVAIPRTEVGRYLDFPVFLDAARGGDMKAEIEVGGFPMPVGERFGQVAQLDPVGFARRLETAVQRVGSELQQATRERDEAQRQKDAAERKYGAPFPEEGELTAKITERAQLQAELAAETAAKDADKPKARVEQDVITGRNEAEFRTELEAQMKRILPNDNIALRIASNMSINSSKVGGQYWNRVITMGIDSARNAPWVLAHETVHAMKAMGLFTPAEWRSLVKAAWTNNPTLRKDVEKRWGKLGLVEEELQEEAVAELFGANWDLFEVELQSSLAKRAIRRLIGFIQAVTNAIRKMQGNSNLTAANILRQMRTGEIGAREVGFGEPARDRPDREVTVTFGRKASVEDGSAGWTPARIRSLIDTYGYFDGRTKAFAGRISPQQFLDVTTPRDMQDQVREDAGALDADRLARETQEPYLLVEDQGNGIFQVVGHEGRHRMAGLSQAGVESVPVVINTRRGAIRETTNATTVLLRENHGGGIQGERNVVLSDPLIPITSENRAALTEQFGRGRIMYSVADDITAAGPEFEGDTEARWKEAKKGVGGGPGVIENSKAWWSDLTAGFTRHWRALPNEPRFSDVQQQLRKLEAAPDAAMNESITYLRKLVGDMDAAEYDLFARKVVLDDLSWDAGEGREIPFGFTPTTLVEARARVDAQINLSPKLVAAVRGRKAHNNRIADQMVRAGVLTREQIKNPAYFRHMVLDYARHEAALARSPTKVKSPYWAKRMGSTLDINANLLEAELDWLQKAQIDMVTAGTIDWIKKSNLNIREELRTRAKDSNRQLLTEAIAGNPDVAKEDNWYRGNIGHGMSIVRKAIEDGHVGIIPEHLRGAAASLTAQDVTGDPPFALFAWMLDNDKPGAMGAGMALKYIGLRKQWIRKLLGERYVEPEDIAGLVRHYKPEGMVAWQPREGQHLFTAKTISEHALDMFVTKLADTASPGIDRAELAAALATVRSQLVTGGDRYTMVIPEELAATLDEFGDRRGEGMVARVFGGLQSAWKRWVLINPRRFFKYNLNNMTGDLDAIIAGNPGALRASNIKEAWTLLRNASRGQIDQRYTDALERGVFTSGLSAQEIPDINMLSEFRHLTEPSKRPDKLAIAGVARVWRALQDTTNFREALFRLAAYLDYQRKIDAGMPQSKIGYGASVPRMVDAVTDPKDRAALLARDLVGDYGSISTAGSWLRRYLIPFWSWTEINTKRYWRLTSNAFGQSYAKGIATGGLLGAGVAARTAAYLYIRMAVVYGVASLWNNLLFDDEEEELGELQRAQLHLILGRDKDGEIITLRTQGALSDVLKTFGFSDAMAAWKKHNDGQGSPGSIAVAMAKAPVNRVATSTTPLLSVPVELMLGQKLWPDIFNTRTINDNYRHVFSALSVENEYDALADRPSRGYLRSWQESAVYKRDPGEMAYDDAKGIAYDWLERVKGQEGGGATSPRSAALRDYRQALRYGDESAAAKALALYESLGGTQKGLATSIARQHPLGPISKKDRQAFLDSLTDEQLDTFDQAERYWQKIYHPED